jgi:hypothetical protein
MSARALEFVETLVSKIPGFPRKSGKLEKLPGEGDETAAKTLAKKYFQAALDENIPAARFKKSSTILKNPESISRRRASPLLDPARGKTEPAG